MGRALLRPLQAVGAGIRTGWLILGITLILIITGEVGLRLALTARDRLLDRQPLTEHKIRGASVDAYHGAPWVPAYIREFDGLLQRLVWHSYVYWRFPPYQGQYIKVSRDGLRATWNPPSQGAADLPSVRVFTFGGSTMWGWGVRDDYTVASHLSKLLYAQGYRAEVTNYGQIAYLNTQEVIALLRCIQRGEVPDIALFYDGINEVISSYQIDAAGIPQNEAKRRTELNLSQQPKRLQRIYGQGFLTRNLWGSQRFVTGLWRRIRPPATTRLDQKWQQSLPLRDEVARQTAHVYESNLALVEALGRRHGFESLFYWQPAIFSKQHRSPDEQAALEAERLFIYEKAFDDIYRRVRRSEALHGNPRFHDISALFDDLEEPYYVDAMHLSEPGNRLVAAAMVDDVIELIERRRAPAAR